MSALSKHKTLIPLRLVALTALFSIALSVATAFLQKDNIEMDLLQKVRKSLSVADLPPVSIAFDGRAATLSGSVDNMAMADEIVAVVNNVSGVSAVSSELETQALGTAGVLLEPFEPEFEKGLYIPPRFHPLEKYGLSAVQFEYSSATLTEASLPVLDKLATLLKQNSQIYIELSVHTDNQGTALGQMTLTKLRADALRRYMLAHGIAPERLLTNGYGSTRPVASNDTAEGRQKNRRVEMAVLDG